MEDIFRTPRYCFNVRTFLNYFLKRKNGQDEEIGGSGVRDEWTKKSDKEGSRTAESEAEEVGGKVNGKYGNVGGRDLSL